MNFRKNCLCSLALCTCETNSHSTTTRFKHSSNFGSVENVRIRTSSNSYTGTRPRGTYNNEIWHEGSRRRCVRFHRNRLRGFRAVRGRKWGLPLTLTVALTTGQHYRAACDLYIWRKVIMTTLSLGERLNLSQIAQTSSHSIRHTHNNQRLTFLLIPE